MTVSSAPHSEVCMAPRRSRIAFWLVFVALSSSIEGAEASMLFSDLGTAESYDSSHGFVIGKPPFSVSQAAEFTNAAAGAVSLDRVDLGLAYISGGNDAMVSLWTANQNTPGSELAQWSISLPADRTAPAGLTSITGISGVSLQPGADYFVQVAAASDGIFSWNSNDVGATTRMFSVTAGGPGQTTIATAPAFQLQGTLVPTPLPASVWLILSGLLPLLFWTAGKKSTDSFQT
jgi:hypothetical protein